MVNVFLIHGSYGNPENNWFPWLKEELEKLNHKVLIPIFPTPEHQSLTNWLNVFKEYEPQIDKNTIFIGHSLGPAFILTLLEKHKIKSAFFVSGFIGLLNNPTFDEINETFTTKEFNWKKIKENCKEFNCFHSDNDPYVPLEKAKAFADLLNTKLMIIPQAGHFNKNSGYNTFPELLNEIKKRKK